MNRMIFYFSGTGNSWSLAKHIGEKLNEEIVSIPQCINSNKFNFECREDEKIGFVFPIHGFRPPKIVLDFIKNINLSNSDGKYVYCVSSGAGAFGCSDKIIYKAIKNIGLNLKGNFTALMPGNYIVSKKVMAEQECNRRLADEEKEVSKIIECIKNKTKTNLKKNFNFIEFVESYIIGKYLFTLSIRNTKFIVNDKKCTNCMMCTKSCPVNAIKKENNIIIRDNDKCTLCMKCINCCPNCAIEFAESTIGKRRYKHPDYKMTEK